jgi:hypothetical protein
VIAIHSGNALAGSLFRSISGFVEAGNQARVTTEATVIPVVARNIRRFCKFDMSSTLDN